MTNFIDWLAGRKKVIHQEDEGINLVIQTINEFENRTFTLKGTYKYSNIDFEEIQRFVQEELPNYYNYTTRIKKYINKKGIPQAKIEIIGRVGFIQRYNPLNIEVCIKTE